MSKVYVHVAHTHETCGICMSLWTVMHTTSLCVVSFVFAEADAVALSEEIRGRVRPRRQELRKAILAERARGVQWLAAVTLFVVWVTEVFDNDTPLRP